MQKRPNGKYQVRWREAGKQRSKDFISRGAAKSFELALSRRGDSNFKPRMKFKELADEWIENHARVNKLESQVNENLSTLRLYLLPEFGEKKLCELDLKMLENLKAILTRQISKAKGKPLSEKSINHIIALAKQIMATGVKWGYIPTEANHWRDVRLLKLKQQDFLFWEQRERDLFIQKLSEVDPDFARAVTLAVHTGIRLGEQLGLQARHVSFERKMLRIEQVWDYKNHKLIKSTKNKLNRTVPLNDRAIEALTPMKLWHPNRFLFEDRSKMRDAAKHMKRYAKRFEMLPIRWHDLRHTFASNLVMAGADLTAVMRLLGHKNIQMTLRYAHLTPEHLFETVRILCASESKDVAKVIDINGLDRGADRTRTGRA